MRFALPILAVTVLVLIGLAVVALRRQAVPEDLRHLSRHDRKAIMKDRAAALRRKQEREELAALQADSDRDFQHRLDNRL